MMEFLDTVSQPNVTWVGDFAGRLDHVREARLSVSRLLAGSRLADDATLCLAELGANAVLHSRTREAGGRFTVRAWIGPRRIYVEVQDQGGPWRAGFATEEGGRGLLIVSQLSTAWGIMGDENGRIAWFELRTDAIEHGTAEAPALPRLASNDRRD